MNRAKTVVDYYVLNNKLKNVIRSGWKNWNVQNERVESVAEHVFGVQSLAIAMHSQYQYDLDLTKVLYMLAIHELEEIIIGDLTSWDISENEKKNKGHEAIKIILKDMINKEEIEALILEFDERKTKEAYFAYQVDKTECDIQCKLYDEQGCVDVSKQDNNPSFIDQKVQELLIKEKGSWSSMWIEFDKNKNVRDEHFIEVLDYVKNNKISK